MSVVLADQGRHAGTVRPVFLACMGDPNDPDTWSSTPYHLLDAGKRLGVIREGLPLQPGRGKYRAMRLAWNASRLLALDRPGGYQYSVGFLESLWRPVAERVRGGVVINQFQLYPPTILHDKSVEKWFYLDATLTLLNKHYGDAPGGRSFRERLRRERENYHAAAGVMTMSRFAADSVVADYGVPPSKVHVVVPGANITGEAYRQWERHVPDPTIGAVGADAPIRMLFVGREVVRKGLDRLLEAISVGRRLGLKANLRIIGLSKEDVLPAMREIPGVEWEGPVYRRTESGRFLDLVSQCDLGCLLSRADFSAIALREYLALGMVVLGPSVGGCADLMRPDSSIAIAADATVDQVAKALLELEADRGRFARMRASAWEHRRSALWDASVQQIAEILGRR